MIIGRFLVTLQLSTFKADILYSVEKLLYYNFHALVVSVLQRCTEQFHVLLPRLPPNVLSVNFFLHLLVVTMFSSTLTITGSFSSSYDVFPFPLKWLFLSSEHISCCIIPKLWLMTKYNTPDVVWVWVQGFNRTIILFYITLILPWH